MQGPRLTGGGPALYTTVQEAQRWEGPTPFAHPPWTSLTLSSLSPPGVEVGWRACKWQAA